MSSIPILLHQKKESADFCRHLLLQLMKATLLTKSSFIFPPAKLMSTDVSGRCLTFFLTFFIKTSIEWNRPCGKESTEVRITQNKGKLKSSQWTGTRTHARKQNQNISTDTAVLLNQKRANVCEHTTRMISTWQNNMISSVVFSDAGNLFMCFKPFL